MKAHIGLALSFLWIVNGFSIPDATNKTKRNLSGEVQYGDPNILWFYADNLKSANTPPRTLDTVYATKPLTLLGVQSPKVFEPKVAAQQVLYEYQQTPTNAVSNVHVKQLFQPDTELPFKHSHVASHSHNPGGVISSETVVTPVHHSHIVHHPPQPYLTPKFHPLYNIQSQQYLIPKKYIHVNGKIIYDPNTLQFQPQNFPHHSHSPQIFQRQPLVNYVNHNQLQRPTVPLPQNTFQPPPKTQLQPIDTPSKMRPQSHKEKPVKENEEVEEGEEVSQYHDDDHESERDETPFGRYSFDDEDSHDHQGYTDHEDAEEEEDDSNRGSTRYITHKVRKYPKKKYQGPKKEETYYRYNYPEDTYPKKNGKKHKMHYKSFKYSKNSRDHPKQELDGGHSEHVPVTHKQKMFKEKWYVSKSSADRERYDVDGMS